MKRTIVSERKLKELKNAIVNRELASVPYIRFVFPQSEGFLINDLFRDINGKEIRRKAYIMAERPNTKASITIIDDI